MCGIAGIHYRSERVPSEATLRAMTSALHHRGPDDSGIYRAPGVGLGHARLSIRDLSPSGHQPQSDPSGRVFVTYNGEIYNDAELRSALAREFGYQFHSTCDTELLPLGYLAWGDALFNKLEGMFALALWDSAARKLILARDGVGIKPLFYSHDGQTLRFASEIKSLLADPEQRNAVSPEGLHAFLGMGYVGPFGSTFEGIQQVPPGGVLTFSQDGVEARRFWRPSRHPEISRMEDAQEEFDGLWTKIVGQHLISDVPVGVLLSGGVDSTLVAYGVNRAASDAPFFTAGFATDAFDETPVAREVATKLGADVQSVPVEVEDDLEGILEKVIHHYDGQVSDEASIALYLLSRAVRRRVAVALSGDGGDEFFAGYSTYSASKIANGAVRHLPRPFWSAMGRSAYYWPASDAQRLPKSALAYRFAAGLAQSATGAHVYWRRCVPSFLLPDLYGPAMRDLVGADPFAGYTHELQEASGSFIDRCLLADQRWHLPGGLLPKSDAMTMAHSLELRVPFLDRRIMDFAGRCSADLLLAPNGEKKALLREFARRLGAPNSVTDGAKRGFNAPLARLLRVGLRSAAERAFVKDADALQPYLNADAVQKLWREHTQSGVDHSYALWPILNFSIAQRRNASLLST